MAFEVYRKSMSAQQKPYVISIQRRGIFALNQPAYEALGDPDAVQFLFDSDRQVVGLRAAAASDEDAYQLRTATTGTAKLATGTKFAEHYGIPTDKGRRYTAILENDVLCFALADGEVS